MYGKRMNQLPPLPTDYIDTARTIADAPEHYQFMLGDLINNKVQEYGSVADLRRARWHVIDQLERNGVADDSTLRDRANMAAFWTPEMREEFDMLSWSQKRAIKAAGSHWRKYAEQAVENLPAPVRVIRAWIRDNGEEQVRPTWERLLERFLDIAYELEQDKEAPGWVRQAAHWIVAECKEWME